MSNLEICQLAFKGDFDQFKVRVTHDPDLLTKLDENQRNCLHWACSGGSTNIVELLLKKGIDVSAKDDSDWTALMIAVSTGREDIVNMLIGRGKDNAYRHILIRAGAI